MTKLSKQKMRALAGIGLALAVGMAGVRPAAGQILLTNVSVVNVTPSGFSVVAAVSPALTSATSVQVSVFTGPAGKGSLAGKVGVEYYPLNTGDPAAAGAYGARLSQAALRQDAINLGLICARVSDCAPGTTYYYQITVTNAGGPGAVWPASGFLPSATTALENSFVTQSQQLLVTLSDANPAGSILILSNANSSSLLAAVVGDGAGTNQALFNVNDMIAASGGTNYSPVGSQAFTATLLGASAGSLTQTYDLIFTGAFTVGQPNTVSLGELATTIALGEGVMLTGGSASVPISVNAQGPLIGLSFQLTIPSNAFNAITVQPAIAAVGAATLAVLVSNTIELTFTAAAGQNLEGSQQIAQLNLTAAAHQPSAFVPLLPENPQGTNATAGVPTAFAIQPGRAVVIGPQPLLETQLAGAVRNLVLYGNPGQSYQLQTRTNLAQAGSWVNYLTVPMTNQSEVFANLDPAPSEIFYRAYQLNADPPLLGVSRIGGKIALLTFGISGTNYALQTTANLSGTILWHPLLTYTLTNTFQYLTNLGPASPAYYRIQKK